MTSDALHCRFVYVIPRPGDGDGLGTAGRIAYYLDACPRPEWPGHGVAFILPLTPHSPLPPEGRVFIHRDGSWAALREAAAALMATPTLEGARWVGLPIT